MIPVMMGIPEIPTPIMARVSTYLSTIQSKTAPNRLPEFWIRETCPSTRSRTAETRRTRLPRGKERVAKRSMATTPRMRERSEIWFGVIPALAKAFPTGSRWQMSLGRSVVIFIHR